MVPRLTFCGHMYWLCVRTHMNKNCCVCATNKLWLSREETQPDEPADSRRVRLDGLIAALKQGMPDQQAVRACGGNECQCCLPVMAYVLRRPR